MTTRTRQGWTLFVTACAALLLAFPALAAKAGGKTPNPNNGHGKITAVSADSITVTPKKTGVAKTFTITSDTKITLDDQPSTAAALAVGQHAHIKSKDGTTAQKIAAHTHAKKGKGKKGGGKGNPIAPAATL